MTFDPHDPEPTYLPAPPVLVADDAAPDEDTYLLALESAQRWLGNYRMSPAMRLRAIRAVVEAALSGQSAV